MSVEEMIFESKQRLKWYINGIGIHNLSSKLFSKLTTERLCELYNVELEFFKLK